ncbi:MAG: hypothetical protein COY58_04845 [Gammaproteobacteria bacterium CG_4_10_14_0_8_um_filter_38_16]|nr:MAG: hypothetical protein COY58_04845 [Gammaproteobacteria bacterium CG_4_10_14_0_8_um_filter_38_16]PJA03343.1 MAG: hypothetical protein COX72_05570 [Gammaproteobacteria bacterium CG_4_10_14_0_2_um_filter_38_22]PJB10657.1 MAG: hypothetical protein CO120_03650 [Gammaproteobacteria bacterium CG_4_9_14_3_um_filter_38_9]
MAIESDYEGDFISSNPADPKLRRQNEVKLLITLLEVADSSIKRQAWISKGLQDALVQTLMKEKRVAEKAAQQPSLRSTQERHMVDYYAKAISHFKSETLNTLSNASIEAQQSLDAFFGDDPKKASAKHKAKKIIQKTFTPALLTLAKDLLAGLANDEITAADALKDIHPAMHDEVMTKYVAAKAASKMDPNTALEAAIKLAEIIAWSKAMKTELKQDIMVTTTAVTSKSQTAVERMETNVVSVIDAEKLSLAYANYAGQFAQMAVSKDSPLGKFICETAAMDDEMGLRGLFEEEQLIDASKLAMTQLTEKEQTVFIMLLNQTVAGLDGQSVGATLDTQATQLKTFHKTDITKITDELAKSLTQHTSELRENNQTTAESASKATASQSKGSFHIAEATGSVEPKTKTKESDEPTSRSS